MDWHAYHAQERTAPRIVDSKRRLTVVLLGFFLLLVVVFGRIVQLEAVDGAAYRAEAVKPIEKRRGLPALRGRIVARDGSVLAEDRPVAALAVHYRYLEDPPDAGWLRSAARARLLPKDRREEAKVTEAERRVLAELEDWADELAAICGLTREAWDARGRQIQQRVERIADAVNERRLREYKARAENEAEDRPSGWVGRRLAAIERFLRGSFQPIPPTPILVAEQLDYHILVDDLPPEIASRIESDVDRWPGAKIVTRMRRVYPAGPLAAHLLGYLGPREGGTAEGGDLADADPRFGRTGLERTYDSLIRGRQGSVVEWTNRVGHVLSTEPESEPVPGADLRLTIDASLQRRGEELLDRELRRRAEKDPQASPAGGAVVVLDVDDGSVLVAASAPRFDPNRFVEDSGRSMGDLLADPAHPLFDRVCSMALPPGSIFKVVSAVAFLQNGTVRPNEPFFCQGYLDTPERERCRLFIHQGIGHGEVTLSDALCESCNVYFFHYGERLGPVPLVDWAFRLGLGQRTGIDLVGEATGQVPIPRTGAAPLADLRGAPTRAMAIGQGELLVTPLQAARLMAIVANGGRLVTPRLVRRIGDATVAAVPTPAVPELHMTTLAMVREGLERVVSDPEGTAYATVRLDTVAVAGKTGTAQTGLGREDHAWFMGYVPAANPRWALAVVMEHGGDAATVAGPIARDLVQALDEAGYLGE